LRAELHPDVSGAPDADERFREVVEAYEVLSKSETRDLYDRYGHAGLRSGGFQASHVDFGNLADLFSAFFGDDVHVRRPLRRRSRAWGRPGCDGRGRPRRGGPRRHAQGAVRGGGDLRSLSRRRCGTRDRDRGLPDVQRIGTAAAGDAERSSASSSALRRARPCAGSARRIEQPCSECRGAGRVVEERTLEVEIPPGIHHGQRIR
jgi:molecular chaperone DnaJ